MSTRKPVYDVFLSHAQAEVAWAVEVEREFTDAGLVVFRVASISAGTNIQDALWEALSESSAMVALVSATGVLPPSFSFELGAAMSWQKPVYVLYKNERPHHLPSYVEQFGVFPADQIDRMRDLVAKGARDLSEVQRRALIDTYTSFGVPLDELLENAAVADQFVRQFNRLSGTRMSGERILRELLRLRKRGGMRPRQHA